MIDDSLKHVYVFADDKVAKKYCSYVKEQIGKKGLDISHYQFDIYSDLSQQGFIGIYFSKDKSTFNQDFKKGLMKIAVEFALHSGLDREYLNSILHIDKTSGTSSFNEDTKIWPFIPLSLTDIIYENESYRMDCNYPSHILKIFSEQADNKKCLVCYVELFSTFQFYILLNEDYKGKDVDFTYAQKLKPNDVPSIEELESLDCSDLDIEIREAGLTYDEIKNLTHEEICKKIHETKRKKGSEYKLYCHLTKSYENILNQIFSAYSCSSSTTDFANKIYCRFLSDNELNYINSNMVEILSNPPRPEDFKRIAIIKQNNKLTVSSYPAMCLKLYSEAPNTVKEYTKNKFLQLSFYCLKK